MTHRSGLSLRDKFEIFDLRAISHNLILSKGRSVMVFEYLSRIDQSLFYSTIEKADLEFQLRIVKESESVAREQLIQKKFFDFSEINKKKSGDFSVILRDSDGKGIGERSIKNEEIGEFAVNGFIYRHFLAVNIPDTEERDMENVMYGFLLDISHLNVPIRRLNTEDLKEYVYNEINYPNTRQAGKKYTVTEKKDEYDHHDDIDEGFIKKMQIFLDGMNAQFWLKIGEWADAIENIYFHKSVSDITTDVVDIFSAPMYIGSNFFQVGNICKGGVIINKGLPIDDFNILIFLFKFMNIGDSITIQIYPGDYHKIGESEMESQGVGKIYGKTEKNETVREGESYIQLLAHFNGISEFLLEDRINKFQIKIGRDFFTQRIEQKMVRYMATRLGTGINKLNNERSYNTERLKNNLSF